MDSSKAERYSRQMILPEIGKQGQERLLSARVLIIGAGGLGSPSALYLAGAGIGKIGIVDFDRVSLDNLHRQILHSTSKVGIGKTESAKSALEALNPDIDIEVYNLRIDATNISDIINEYDIVIDGTDNISSKYLINDACVFLKKPLIHGGILRFEGQVITIIPDESACYRCIFTEPPKKGVLENCQQAGILGTVAGIIGTIQANEAIKYIVGIGEQLIDRMLFFDALSGSFRSIDVKRNKTCPICGDNPTITKLESHEFNCQGR